jgi:hypothetical protein
MSALEELWQWLQGRTLEGPDTNKSGGPTQQQQQQAGQVDEGNGSKQADADLAARIQRNTRYRAGPWQMK